MGVIFEFEWDLESIVAKNVVVKDKCLDVWSFLFVERRSWFALCDDLQINNWRWVFLLKRVFIVAVGKVLCNIWKIVKRKLKWVKVEVLQIPKAILWFVSLVDERKTNPLNSLKRRTYPLA